MVGAQPTIRLRFYGHACFGLFRGDEPLLCLDPFEPGSLGGSVALAAPPDIFRHVFCSHEHVDHSAVHIVPAAERVHAPFQRGDLRITGRVASHDEFGGRLRGGAVVVARIEVASVVVIVCGDLGERPTDALLDWLRAIPTDVLITPVGGHFTLNADAAAEMASLVSPRYLVPCHSADDGVRLAELAGRSVWESRWPGPSVRSEELVLAPRRLRAEPTVAWLAERPAPDSDVGAGLHRRVVPCAASRTAAPAGRERRYMDQ